MSTENNNTEFKMPKNLAKNNPENALLKASEKWNIPTKLLQIREGKKNYIVSKR